MNLWRNGSFQKFWGRLVQSSQMRSKARGSMRYLSHKPDYIACSNPVINKLSSDIGSLLTDIRNNGNIQSKRSQLERLQETMDTIQSSPDEVDYDHLSSLYQRHCILNQQMEELNEMESTYRNSMDFLTLAEEEQEADTMIITECQNELTALLDHCQNFQFSILMNDEEDAKGCFVQVSVGSGGLEAQDWAETLFHMYANWAKLHKYAHQILSTRRTDAGIHQGVLEITADYAYGWLKLEQGVHRRCRVSPFGTGSGRMQTSFASVSVTAMAERSEYILDERDVTMEAFRGWGPGGQHKNTTDSAVRLKHIPTGITVVCQEERSMHANKALAMKLLSFKIKQSEEEKEREVKQEKYASLDLSTFGSQIRSYKFHPYQLAKDSRTSCEMRNINGVMAGEIDVFLKSSLQWSAAQTLEEDEHTL